MNKILIVHAHPEEKSFNSALKNTAQEYFISQGAEVVVSDLYKMNFNPVGGKHDFTEISNPDFFKYQMEQVNAFQNNLFVEEVKQEMENFLWADTVIFNFPLWWFGLPAILKGWVDRIFAMGVTYGAGKGVYDNGTFKDKKSFLTFTTGGPAVAYGETGKNGNLDTILYPIQHGMFYFVGMQVLPYFVSYSPARTTDEERKMELVRYKIFLSQLHLQKSIF